MATDTATYDEETAVLAKSITERLSLVKKLTQKAAYERPESAVVDLSEAVYQLSECVAAMASHV